MNNEPNLIRLYNLVEQVLSYLPDADEGAINRAYVFAMRKHGTQARASGGPYVTHLINKAFLLAKAEASVDEILCSLLSDTIEDTDATVEEIEALFGVQVADTLKQLTQKRRIIQSLHASGTGALETIRMVLVLEPSSEVLLLLCSEAAVSLETILELPEHKRKRIIDLAASVFWPLSMHLGFEFISSQIESLLVNAQWTDKEKAKILSGNAITVSALSKMDMSDWKSIKVSSDYSLVEGGQLASLSEEDMIYYSSMSDDEYQNLLSEAFLILGKLPAGELKRITETAKKKLENWPDGVLTRAPELYQQRPRGEDLPQFLRRVYKGPGHLNGKLTTAHLDVIDPPLATAIYGWTKKRGSLPADILLPHKIERAKGTKPTQAP